MSSKKRYSSRRRESTKKFTITSFRSDRKLKQQTTTDIQNRNNATMIRNKDATAFWNQAFQSKNNPPQNAPEPIEYIGPASHSSSSRSGLFDSSDDSDNDLAPKKLDYKEDGGKEEDGEKTGDEGSRTVSPSLLDLWQYGSGSDQSDDEMDDGEENSVELNNEGDIHDMSGSDDEMDDGEGGEERCEAKDGDNAHGVMQLYPLGATLGFYFFDPMLNGDREYQGQITSFDPTTRNYVVTFEDGDPWTFRERDFADQNQTHFGKRPTPVKQAAGTTSSSSQVVNLTSKCLRKIGASASPSSRYGTEDEVTIEELAATVHETAMEMDAVATESVERASAMAATESVERASAMAATESVERASATVATGTSVMSLESVGATEASATLAIDQMLKKKKLEEVRDEIQQLKSLLESAERASATRGWLESAERASATGATGTSAPMSFESAGATEASATVATESVERASAAPQANDNSLNSVVRGGVRHEQNENEENVAQPHWAPTCLTFNEETQRWKVDKNTGEFLGYYDKNNPQGSATRLPPLDCVTTIYKFVMDGDINRFKGKFTFLALPEIRESYRYHHLRMEYDHHYPPKDGELDYLFTWGDYILSPNQEAAFSVHDTKQDLAGNGTYDDPYIVNVITDF